MIPSDSEHWQILDVRPFKQAKHLFELRCSWSCRHRRIYVVAARNKKFWFANRISNPLTNHIIDRIKHDVCLLEVLYLSIVTDHEERRAGRSRNNS